MASRLSAVVLSGLLAVTIAACGSNDSSTGAEAGSSSASTPAAQSTAPVADLKDLSKGKTTSVTLDPGFLAGLTSLKLTPSTLGSATLDASTGVVTFPITGGNVTVYKPGTVTPYVQGMIRHDGSGLQLVGGGKTVQLTDFVVDPGTSMLSGKVTVDGQVAYPTAPLFFLDGSTLQPLRMEGTDAVLEGTTVSLTKEAAGALNTVFGTTALTPFFKVGVAKITVATQ